METPQGAGEEPAGEGPAGESDRPTVLVADDDAAVRTTLRRLLEREGMRVIVAEDGARAMEAVAGGDPDLVLLDVLMPRLSGLEVCRRIKADPELRLLPVVLLTGLDGRNDRLAGIEAGADDFVSKPFDRAELIARVQSLVRVKRYTDELERAEAVIMALGRAVEERDPYTRGHCDRLAAMSAELGRRLGLPPTRLVHLEQAGYLHDIGKITVPDAILNKRGRLTAEERRVVESHPEAGERICQELRSLGPVLPIIRHHHERLDGSGYPDGLAGEEIPLAARILQVVDVYDALTTARPYKEALPPAEAVEIMEGEVEAGWWDRRVFEELREMVRGDGLPES